MSSVDNRTAAELVDNVKDVFTIPEMYLRLKELIDDDSSSINDLGELISGDPAMSARLLRFSNSAFFGMSRQIDTVARAASVLGTQLVHDIVLATSVIEASSTISDSIDLRGFWSDSAYCGVVARIVAQRCDVLDSERVFLEGLLRDIGHLVMYQQVLEKTAAAQAESISSGRPLYKVEETLIGCHYGAVGKALMDAWNLPSSFGEVARHHVEPGQSQAAPLESAIVHIAHHIALAVGADEDPSREDLPVDPGAWTTTGLSPDVIASVVEEAETAAGETRALFLDAA